MVYCDNPFECVECEGAWTCADVAAISTEVIAYYDTNGDATVNPEDDIEYDHYEILVEYCDYNNDGTVEPCEVFDCVVVVEN